MANSTSHLPPGVVTEGYHLRGTLAFQLASFVMLLYDHALTFDEEVERVWKQPFTGATILFLLNRYGTPLEFIVVLAAFQGAWPDDVCKRFVKFEGAGTVTMVGICELIMILRVYALHRGRAWVLVLLLATFSVQIALQGVALLHTWRQNISPKLPHSCILGGRSNLTAMFWAAPLITDACIFILTTWQTARYFHRDLHQRTPILEVVLRDGVLYFAVISVINVINMIVYLFAPLDLRLVGASFTQLITSVMVSHLVLNLRSLRSRSTNDRTSSEDDPAIGTSILPFSSDSRTVASTRQNRRMRHEFSRSWIGTRLVGNLGEEVEVEGAAEPEGKERDVDPISMIPLRHKGERRASSMLSESAGEDYGVECIE